MSGIDAECNPYIDVTFGLASYHFPLHGGNYHPDSFCEWVLSGPLGFDIAVKFTSFQVITGDCKNRHRLNKYSSIFVCLRV